MSAGRRHGRRVAVAGVLLAVGAGSAIWLSGRGGPSPEALPGLPRCRAGYVAVAWPGDGERLGCVEDLARLLAAAEAAAGCTPGARPKRVRSGDRVRLWREEVACDYEVGSLDGSTRLALGLPIDLNRASAQDLTALPGIGPDRARAIVAYRRAHGPFAHVEELEAVHGIGPKTLARIREKVTVSEAGR